MNNLTISEMFNNFLNNLSINNVDQISLRYEEIITMNELDNQKNNNLRNMCAFYQTFPKWNAVRTIKLKQSWLEDKTFSLALLMQNHPVKVSVC
jgi:hypothetical protein